MDYILLNSTKKTNVLNFIKIVDNVCKENNFNSLKFDKNNTSMKNSISAFLEKNINNRQILKHYYYNLMKLKMIIFIIIYCILKKI